MKKIIIFLTVISLVVVAVLSSYILGKLYGDRERVLVGLSFIGQAEELIKETRCSLRTPVWAVVPRGTAYITINMVMQDTEKNSYAVKRHEFEKIEMDGTPPFGVKILWGKVYIAAL